MLFWEARPTVKTSQEGELAVDALLSKLMPRGAVPVRI